MNSEPEAGVPAIEATAAVTPEQVTQPTGPIERVGTPEEVAAYEDRRGAARAIAEESRGAVVTLAARLAESRQNLRLPPENPDAPSLAAAAERAAALELAAARAEANYPGDWTQLLRERMESPANREKFAAVRAAGMETMREGEPGRLDKPHDFKDHYRAQLENYDQNLEAVFAATDVGPAAAFGKNPDALGTSGSSSRVGAVFTDAPLTDRQKNMIEAHEKGHSMRDFRGADRGDLIASIDHAVVAARGAESGRRISSYLANPDEIAERMAQLKNYFGFRGDEVLTPAHLRVARERFVADTGLDNSMADLFAAVTPDREAKFLDTLNRYPL